MLDEVFVISGKIKVGVSVIRPDQRPKLIPSGGGGGGGVLLGILGGGAPLGSPNPISEQTNIIFQIRFQTYTGRNYDIITYNTKPTKRFLKIYFEFAYHSFFLLHLELKGQICS